MLTGGLLAWVYLCMFHVYTNITMSWTVPVRPTKVCTPPSNNADAHNCAGHEICWPGFSPQQLSWPAQLWASALLLGGVHTWLASRALSSSLICRCIHGTCTRWRHSHSWPRTDGSRHFLGSLFEHSLRCVWGCTIRAHKHGTQSRHYHRFLDERLIYLHRFSYIDRDLMHCRYPLYNQVIATHTSHSRVPQPRIKLHQDCLRSRQRFLTSQIGCVLGPSSRFSSLVSRMRWSRQYWLVGSSTQPIWLVRKRWRPWRQSWWSLILGHGTRLCLYDHIFGLCSYHSGDPHLNNRGPKMKRVLTRFIGVQLPPGIPRVQHHPGGAGTHGR